MKLAAEFRKAIQEARRVCGSPLGTTLDALGYVPVPVAFVEVFIKLLEKSDEKKAADNMSDSQEKTR